MNARRSGEVFPALRLERLAAFSGTQRNGRTGFGSAKNAADAGDGNSGDGAGDMCAGRGGKEELVIFAAMKGLGQGGGGMEREPGGVDLGGDARFLAEVGEIGGEAVAQVDGGGGKAASLEKEALGEARLGVEMRGQSWKQALGDAERVRFRRQWRQSMARAAAAPPRLPVT